MSIVLAKISKINYELGKADITIPDKNQMVVTDVPFLSEIYEMPEIGDPVFAVIENDGKRFGRGVILGRFYSNNNPPRLSGKNIFAKEFSDGEGITYDSSTKTLTITADKVVVNKLFAKEIHPEE